MPALVAADVTVVISRRRRSGKRKWHEGTLAFGDGAKTYPTAGIPLPAASAFGFSRVLETLSLYGVNERTTDYMTRFGPANKTLLLYDEEVVAVGGPLLEALTSEAPPARTYSYQASGW